MESKLIESKKLEKLKLLKKGVEQLNKKLFAFHLILSIAIASSLTLFIDYFWDLRFIVFLIWVIILSYAVYKLVFKIKFSRLKKRIDFSQQENEYPNEMIEKDFVSLKIGHYKLRLNFNNCVYTLTDDFIFVFQTFKILAIFFIDKSKPNKVNEKFLLKFKGQRNLKLTSILAIIIITIVFLFKFSLIQLNHKLLSNDSEYRVQEIIIGDKILYDSTNTAFVILTNNFLTDHTPDDNVVRLHCRIEYFDKIRLVYETLSNSTENTNQIFKEKLLGLYSYQINNNEITLAKGNITILIKSVLKNPTPNNVYKSLGER